MSSWSPLKIVTTSPCPHSVRSPARAACAGCRPGWRPPTPRSRSAPSPRGRTPRCTTPSRTGRSAGRSAAARAPGRRARRGRGRVAAGDHAGQPRADPPSCPGSEDLVLVGVGDAPDQLRSAGRGPVGEVFRASASSRPGSGRPVVPRGRRRPTASAAARPSPARSVSVGVVIQPSACRAIQSRSSARRRRR